ncbi:MAG: YitT family protein [Peptostreptococcaceae bacterium]|nr:YitT family protein [Peptostreptococcaceae bacterium]
MSKYQIYIKKSLIVFLGMVFLGLGINLIIYANIGVDPFTTGAMGVFKLINKYGDYTFGNAQIVINVVFLTIAFFLNKRKIGYGTLISAVVIGFSVDLWKIALVASFPAEINFISSLLILILGCIVIGTGIAIYISPDFGLGAGEILPMIASEKTGWKFKYLKIAGDLIFFLIGVSLGAAYGVGTIISLVLIGPIAHQLLPYVKRIFNEEDHND